MCSKCEVIVNCPVGEKRKVDVQNAPFEKVIDAYGRSLFVGSWTMFVDKYPDGSVDCGIYREVHDENFVHYGGVLDITHCPFCGEMLV